MHIGQIEKTELNGMILQHTQTLPEVVYNGCVICFINFNGDIEGVGIRITELSSDEFMTLKELIGQIEFDGREKVDYAIKARAAMECIKSTAERLLNDFESYETIWDDDLKKIRSSLTEIELINAKIETNW